MGVARFGVGGECGGYGGCKPRIKGIDKINVNKGFVKH